MNKSLFIFRSNYEAGILQYYVRIRLTRSPSVIELRDYQPCVVIKINYCVYLLMVAYMITVITFVDLQMAAYLLWGMTFVDLQMAAYIRGVTLSTCKWLHTSNGE